jgi:hypothetical protein
MKAIPQTDIQPPLQVSQSITPGRERASASVGYSPGNRRLAGQELRYRGPAATSLGESLNGIIEDVEGLIVFVILMVVWFLVLPRIPGVSRFT